MATVSLRNPSRIWRNELTTRLISPCSSSEARSFPRIVLNQQNFYLFMIHCCHYLFSLMSSGSLLSILLGRKAEKKGSAFIHLRFSPNAPAVLVNDSLHGGQSHACSFEVLLTVKTLKDAK